MRVNAVGWKRGWKRGFNHCDVKAKWLPLFFFGYLFFSLRCFTLLHIDYCHFLLLLHCCTLTIVTSSSSSTAAPRGPGAFCGSAKNGSVTTSPQTRLWLWDKSLNSGFYVFICMYTHIHIYTHTQDCGRWTSP